MSKTYKELGVPPVIVNLLEEKAQEDGFDGFKTPAGLKAWLANKENDISEAVNGIGPEYEKVLIAALKNIPDPEPIKEDAKVVDGEGDGKTAVDTQATDTKADSKTEKQPDPKPTADNKPTKKKSGAKKPDPKADPADEVQYITIKLPVGSLPPDNYETQQARGGRLSVSGGGSRHLQMRLNPDEAIFFLRVREGVRITGEKRADGRPAWETPDVMRVIASKGLDQLS